MHQHDLNRVYFYSVEDLAGLHQLSKGEKILRTEIKSNYTDINEVIELYSIKKYLDNEIYLKSWTQEEIEEFKQKAKKYGQKVGNYFANINDKNVIKIYEQTLFDYIQSFWEIVCNHSLYKQISKSKFSKILEIDHHLIHEILTHKVLVTHYNIEIKNFLLDYPGSAEILLSVYETEVELKRNQKYIPKSLTISDKESIISKYLDSVDTNLNYIGLIENARNRNDFRISDKTRLKAKRLRKSETEKFFADKGGMSFGVSVGFSENVDKIKDVHIDENLVTHYAYSSEFIKKNNHPYQLYQNFKLLFEFIDNQNRINLVSKKSQLGLFEKIMGVHSKNEYKIGTGFSLSEMTSRGQIYGYNKIITELNTSLENILHFVYTEVFQELYGFADNARFATPKPTNTFFEKVRLFAPEFESILKQFKLYVEDGEIDFELLQISSSPTTIKSIPSLVQNKYVYFNNDNKEMVGCSNLFFSDQTLLAYVEPFKEDKYHTFFDLLVNAKVNFSNYQEHQKLQLNYLIERNFIVIDDDGFIQVTNPARLFIFKDLYDNEFSSFYRYPIEFQREALQMQKENIVLFESSLFSKPEQSYFNFFLNKSEFTNGLDLRNRYLHGTQANPEEIEKHEYAYFTYLKLVVLTLLKIDDDLQISNTIQKQKEKAN
ncbi:hypothetical protein KFZ70_04175 [Tamlana fucoidanivorans]|uniref:Uncharacterized protein n=1 Tax=Allotamlana fucoidanivorans TaxID=2583814 RepID=A0A5C4SDC8_9FLAO|nr:hypothetical protein [Tamlana fucoidanivorans]TNJ41359.1 hypothetical protein FGF67_16125 [Tamlana fucoidanivorans]